MPIKIYVDTGALIPELRSLEKDGRVSLYQFQYENRTKKIKHVAMPSQPTWAQSHYTWKELGHLTWADLGKQSDKWSAILMALGRDNHTDAQHLDSSYMSGCQVFATSDKGDIVARRAELEGLLQLRIFHVPSEQQQMLMHLNNIEQDVGSQSL